MCETKQESRRPSLTIAFKLMYVHVSVHCPFFRQLSDIGLDYIILVRDQINNFWA